MEVEVRNNHRAIAFAVFTRHAFCLLSELKGTEVRGFAGKFGARQVNEGSNSKQIV